MGIVVQGTKINVTNVCTFLLDAYRQVDASSRQVMIFRFRGGKLSAVESGLYRSGIVGVQYQDV